MKTKVAMMLMGVALAFSAAAQRDNEDNSNAETGGFKKENIFIGGNLNLGFATGVFNIGATPEIGYSVAEFMDAGLVFNINYGSISPDYNYGIKQSSTNYGVGAFTRLYPVRFLFAQAQYEHNWINYKLTDQLYGNPTQKINTNSNSLLLGVGYAQRMIGNSNFYVALLFDVTKEIYSPYVDSYGNAMPVLRTGFNFYLKPSRKDKSDRQR